MRERKIIEEEADKWFENGKVDLVLEVALDIRDLLLKSHTTNK